LPANSAFIGSTASFESAPPRSGSGWQIAHGSSDCNTGTMHFGHATVTSPAPDRSAAPAASAAAPAMPRLPATTSTCPRVPLCVFRGKLRVSAFAGDASSTGAAADR